MTSQDDLDRTLAGWFEADARSPAPAGELEQVIEASRRRRPRPAWLAGPGSRWVGEAPSAGSGFGLRLLPPFGLQWSTALIVLLLIAAIVGGAVFVGARLFENAPLPTVRLGHLAYGLDGDIFVADQDGRNPVRIADGAPADNGPGCQDYGGEGRMWSPDGRYLAYRSGCRGTVEVSDPEGRHVASLPGTGWFVAWSPDSSRVATWVDLSKTVGIYGLDGVRQALLTLPAEATPTGDYDPVWSPDGTSVLIRHGGQIWELPVDGRAARLVPSTDPRSNWRAAYSPDRARVAFAAERAQPAPYLFPAESLVVGTADGSEDRVVVSGGVALGIAGAPVWSPTGDRIAFDQGPITSQELRVVDLATGAVTTLVTAPGAGAPGAGAAPSAAADPGVVLQLIRFAPEGDRILYSRSDSELLTSLWSVGTDGSDPERLVTGTDWGDWQPVPAGP